MATQGLNIFPGIENNTDSKIRETGPVSQPRPLSPFQRLIARAVLAGLVLVPGPACDQKGQLAFNQDDVDLASDLVPPDAGAAADQSTSSGDGPPPDKVAPEEDMFTRVDGRADEDLTTQSDQSTADAHEQRDGQGDGPVDFPPPPEGGIDARQDGPVVEGGALDGPPADLTKPDLCVPRAPECTTTDTQCGNPVCPDGLGTKLEECRPVYCDDTLGPTVRDCKC